MTCIGIPKETYPGEDRVALIPTQIAEIQKKTSFDVLVESGAGVAAGFPDSEYEARGARMVDRAELLEKSDVLLLIRGHGANPGSTADDLQKLKSGAITIATEEPLDQPERVKDLAAAGVTAFSLELVPRITRAQSMDVLSSMATLAGYKAVLLAAETLPRIFPMLMTAAGTLAPARVFVIGVGVAGLQALATAKRLGAVCEAYDVRPAVKDQVQSVGARFVEFDLDTAESEDKGGYAKAQSEEFYKKQQELMGDVIAENDVVITTAAIPGRKAPVLVTKAMVDRMKPGSVVVDLAAERGGNCELTRSGEVVVENGVTILGPENIPSTVPYHASQMFSKNITTFLFNLLEKVEGDGEGVELKINTEDEIVEGSLLTRNGEVVHARVRDLLGLSSEAAEV